MSAALPDCGIHRVVEHIAAIRIGVACGIVAVRAVINLAASAAERDGCGRRQEQTIAERNIGGHRRAICLLNLLGVAFLGNVLIRMLQQRAVAVRKNARQIQ